MTAEARPGTVLAPLIAVVAGGAGLVVKPGEIAHEVATVGEIDIVHAGADAGTRHGIVGALERAGGMDDD